LWAALELDLIVVRGKGKRSAVPVLREVTAIR
jgi:hypothetical protein